MKLSVIMGIVHMTIGVVMKGTNNVFQGDYPSLIFEVCTGLTMLLGLFGWMDLLILSKWFFPVNYASREIIVIDGKNEWKGDAFNRKTPSVINVMITTVFGGGSPPGGEIQYSFLVPGDRTTYPASPSMQATMYNTSMILLVLAVICVPLMLLVKPLCCRKKHAVHENAEIEFAQISQVDNDNQQHSINAGHADGGADDLLNNRKKQMKSIDETLQAMAGDGENHNFGDIMVH
jgi:V-type H+-transporting ATPase subunit a